MYSELRHVVLKRQKYSEKLNNLIFHPGHHCRNLILRSSSVYGTVVKKGNKNTHVHGN